MDEVAMSPDPLKEAFVYEHEAMNTKFTIRLVGMDDHSARSLAQLCIERIDLLEGLLSRFRDGSDVSRINTLPQGETLYISDDCHECLIQAMRASQQTHGLFDITLGSRIEHRKEQKDGPLPELQGRIQIHPDEPAVTCDEPGRVIDLGGIGKGFALDQLRHLLVDWKAGGALLTAGASSMLSYGSTPWPIDLGGADGEQRIQLEGLTLSASGTGIQGSHLIHPWGEEAMPEKPCERVWVVADSAAMAEVWSTALMLIEPEEFEEALAQAEGVQEVHAQRDGKVWRVL